MPTEHHTLDVKRLRDEYEDSLFRLAMAGYAEEYGKKLQAENEALKAAGEFNPTPEGIKRFNKALDKAFLKRNIVKSVKRTYGALNKVAAILIMIVCVFSITAMSVGAIRIEILNFLIGFEQEYTSLRLDTSKGNNIIGDNLYVSWTDAYVPTYIPEGYQIVNLANNQDFRTITYENAENQKILYYEYSDSMDTNIDTENADVENIIINGNDGLLVSKNGIVSVAWSNGQKIFVIHSQLSKDEIMRVAENILFIK